MLWDLAEGKKLYSLEANETIHALCFSPNRYWLCAATDSAIQVRAPPHPPLPLAHIPLVHCQNVATIYGTHEQGVKGGMPVGSIPLLWAIRELRGGWRAAFVSFLTM